jgi:hypothetical protein
MGTTKTNYAASLIAGDSRTIPMTFAAGFNRYPNRQQTQCPHDGFGHFEQHDRSPTFLRIETWTVKAGYRMTSSFPILQSP